MREAAQQQALRVVVGVFGISEFQGEGPVLPSQQVEVPPLRLSAPPSEAVVTFLAQKNPSYLAKMTFGSGAEAVEGSGYPRSKDELHPGSTLWGEETSTWLSSCGSLSTTWHAGALRLAEMDVLAASLTGGLEADGQSEARLGHAPLGHARGT